MAPQDRVAVRQARAKPVFDQLEEWLHAQLPRLSGKSPLAQAIRYALGRMPKARPYLSNGHLELDNNETLFAIGSRTMVERRTRCQAGGHRAKKLDVFRLRGGRQSHGYRLHADRNRQTEQRRPPRPGLPGFWAKSPITRSLGWPSCSPGVTLLRQRNRPRRKNARALTPDGYRRSTIRSIIPTVIDNDRSPPPAPFLPARPPILPIPRVKIGGRAGRRGGRRNWRNESNSLRLGIASRSWRASPAHCATGPRSRTGICHRPCAVCSASSNDSAAATGRWSRSSGPCSRWPGRRRSRLRRGFGPQRPFRGVVLNILARRHARGVLPARRTAATLDYCNTGCVAPEARVPRDGWPRACGQLRPLRQPEENNEWNDRRCWTRHAEGVPAIIDWRTSGATGQLKLLSYDFPRLPRQKGATARHAILWRAVAGVGSREAGPSPAPCRSGIAPVFIFCPERIPGLRGPDDKTRKWIKTMQDTIGIDISKPILDAFRLATGEHRQFPNDKPGCKALMRWIGKAPARVVFEPTGPYHRVLGAISHQGRDRHRQGETALYQRSLRMTVGIRRCEDDHPRSLDRLTRHCEIVETGNESWRFKDRA